MVRSRSSWLSAALLALAVLLGLAGPAPAATSPPRTGSPGSTGSSVAETVAAMQPGWNLGNTLDATGPDETSWGNPRVTRAQLSAIRDQGFRSVRVPVTWSRHQGPAPGYTIDPAQLARVTEVAGWALEEGLYVMVNVHHDSWQWIMEMPSRPDAVLERFVATYEQIAAAFRDAPPELLLESVNEPFFEGSSGDAENAELLHRLNAAFVSVVRDSGGVNATRPLVLSTLHASSEQERLDELAASLATLDDPALVATVHFYGYWPFSVNVAGHTRFDEVTRQDLIDTFDRVHDTFTARGVPVIVGEYGLLGFDRGTETVQQGEKLKFFAFLGQYARQKRLTTMLWDNGQHFDRTAGRWRDPALFRQISTSWSVDSATGSTDQVFVPATGTPAEATVGLDLAGTEVTAVRHGADALAPGGDYVLSGDGLTLTADTLARLTADRPHGVAAVLSVEFARGAPWDVHIIRYEMPQPADATGTTAGFAVPVAFRGDRLATMEAVYADGGNAGPHDWTPFKEFGAAFSPDYAGERITLTPEFFDEIRDGSTVRLTFHFWSGHTREYTLTRSGTTVTGTAGG
ncbi:cellulase family glycosylhydrolase [Streptomyces sp. NPDC059853]|uniref:cellulase family glycosylhydrolase n=1 Tax=Streptomyces sp. NPDC059853 TaxID=3346973 RepID=UPI003667CFAB